MLEHVFAKLSSGRWILTVISGIVFAILAISGKLNPEDTMKILLIVFTLYFTRNDRGKENGTLPKV